MGERAGHALKDITPARLPSRRGRARLMRVLVLRPADGARRTAARLAALGHEAICAPLIETVATGENPPLPAPSTR